MPYNGTWEPLILLPVLPRNAKRAEGGDQAAGELKGVESLIRGGDVRGKREVTDAEDGVGVGGSGCPDPGSGAC